MVLAEIPSESNPDTTYKLMKAKDGSVYCTCPAWRFSGKNGKPRDCKHLSDKSRIAVANSILSDPNRSADAVERALALTA